MLLVLPGALCAVVWIPLALFVHLKEASVGAGLGAAGCGYLLVALSRRSRGKPLPFGRGVRCLLTACCVMAALWVLLRLDMTHLCWYPSAVVLAVALANTPSMIRGHGGTRGDQLVDRVLPWVLGCLWLVSLPYYRAELEASWRRDPVLLVAYVANSPHDWNLAELTDYLGTPTLTDDGSWWWSASGSVGGDYLPFFAREILIVEADAGGKVLSATRVDPFEVADAVEASPGSWTAADISRLLGTRQYNGIGEGWYIGPSFGGGCYLNVELTETGRVRTARLDCWD